MIVEFVSNLGIWGWLIAGLLILGLEIIVPGYFFLWIGGAAIAVGLLSLGSLGSWGFWTVPVQWFAFAIFALIAIIVGRKFYDPRNSETDEPLLNQRAAQLVGRQAIVIDAITNGTGRAKVGDTIWRVEGPDADIGTAMIVTEAQDNALTVSTKT